MDCDLDPIVSDIAGVPPIQPVILGSLERVEVGRRETFRAVVVKYDVWSGDTCGGERVSVGRMSGSVDGVTCVSGEGYGSSGVE